MANFFNIKITPQSTSPGLYTIYYDSISSGTVALKVSDGSFADNITLNQLQLGVVVEVPDPTTKVILYNKSCDTFLEFTVTPKTATYPCICVVIFDKVTGDIDKIEGCYSNQSFNSKPLYSGPQAKLVWKGGFWEMSGFTKPGVVFRSTDNDDIPNSLWNAAGGGNSNNYTVFSQTGTCSSVALGSSLLIADGTDASCNNNDGSIVASALGGDPPWSYSLNNIQYFQVGVFGGLSGGSYFVYAKDSSGTLIVDNVTISTPPINVFSVESTNIQVSTLALLNNVQYYSIKIPYNTSQIPTGEAITFDYEITYSLIYNGPGDALFETNQNSLTKNANGIPLIAGASQNPIATTQTQCNFNFFTYEGFKKYFASSISLSKNDSFELNLVFGIDTTTLGDVVGTCRTEAYLSLSAQFQNTNATCDCCLLDNNTINYILPVQIFI